MDMQAYKYRVDEPRCYVCSAYEYTQDSPLREDFKGRSVCETCWSEMHTDPPADDPLARPLFKVGFSDSLTRPVRTTPKQAGDEGFCLTCRTEFDEHHDCECGENDDSPNMPGGR